MRYLIVFDNRHNSKTENCAICMRHDEWWRGICTFVGKGNGDNGRNWQFPMRMSAVEAAGFSTLKRLKSTAVRPDSAEPVLGRRLPRGHRWSGGFRPSVGVRAGFGAVGREMQSGQAGLS